MINLEVIVEEFLSSADLLGVQALCINKFLKIVIIGKYDNLIFVAFQILVLIFKSLNNSQKLLVLNLIASLGQYYFFGEKNFRVLLANIAKLKKKFYLT